MIGNEIDEGTLKVYDDHCHQNLLPPRQPKKVTGLVGDGHQKVLLKLCGHESTSQKRRVGRPRDDGNENRGHGHGWFMLIDPVSSRILGIVSQDVPENNKVVSASLLKILPLYPKVDLLIMDRCCHYMKAAQSTSGLEQIKFFSLDRFHSSGHTSKCPCNPRSKTRLKNRIKGLNTSIAEQTFSWFRGYSKVLNDMRPLRHRFAVLLFCKWQNDLVENGNAQYLNQYKVHHKKKARKSYACNKGNKKAKLVKSMKGKKQMKAMKAMKAKKDMKNMKAMK